MRLLDIKTAGEWNRLIEQLPQAHVLQTWEWGQSKRRNGWVPQPYIWEDSRGQVAAASLVLNRQLRLGPVKVSVLYSPKGPLVDWSDLALTKRVLDDMQALARQKRAAFIKIDPDVRLGTGIPGSEDAREEAQGHDMEDDLKTRGWRFSDDQIQFRNTVLIDLTRSEEDILAAMKQKTRYNIGLSGRKGVGVRAGTTADLPMLYRMYAATAVRDDFVIRHEDYYLDLWRGFMDAGKAEVLFAEFEGQPIAALVLFHFAGVSRYMFGMSTEAQRELMPNYLLQWEAIRLSKKLGCHTYDMWGAPDVFDKSDSMWGVYRFKEGFNGLTVRHLGAWDYTSRPLLYRLYTRTLPKLLDLMRRRGKAENRRTSGHD